MVEELIEIEVQDNCTVTGAGNIDTCRRLKSLLQIRKRAGGT
jgi:hypothetical protein